MTAQENSGETGPDLSAFEAEFTQQLDIDVSFMDVLERCRALDESMSCKHTLTGNDIDALNQGLDSKDMLGRTVTVTGIIRYRPDIEYDESYDDYLEMHGVKGSDGKDSYFTLGKVPLVLATAWSDAAPNKSWGDARPVFTFVSPGQLYDAEEDNDIGDLVHNPGPYMMYADDIFGFEFDIPTIEHVLATLERDHPEFYHSFHVILSDTGEKLSDKLRRLQTIAEILDDKLPPHLVDAIGRVAFEKLGFDDAPHRFGLQGDVYGIAADDSQVPDHNPRPMVGWPVTARFAHMDGRYVPNLIVAEMSIEKSYHGRSMYEARVVPVESICTIKSLAPTARRFGKLTQLQLDSPDSVRRYWEYEMDHTRPTANEMGSITDEQTTLDGREDDLDLRSGGVNYNEDHGFYEFDVHADIQRLLQDFTDHRETLGLATESLKPEAVQRLDELMLQSLSRLRDLRLGDKVISSGELPAISIEEHESEVYAIMGDYRILGELVSIEVSAFPDVDTITTQGDHSGMRYELGAVIKKPSIIDGPDTSDDSFRSEIVVIPLRFITGKVQYSEHRG